MMLEGYLHRHLIQSKVANPEAWLESPFMSPHVDLYQMNCGVLDRNVVPRTRQTAPEPGGLPSRAVLATSTPSLMKIIARRRRVYKNLFISSDGTIHRLETISSLPSRQHNPSTFSVDT